MGNHKSNPTILIVTSEVTYLPNRMGDNANFLTAKAGGLADVSAALISALFDQGADVHIAIPDYRALFNNQLPSILRNELNIIRMKMPEERIHLAEDCLFFYMDKVYSQDGWLNTKISLAFQREVINNIVPLVQPDLIHCNDWMTGLVPAMARRLGIPCLFTFHNIHTVKCPLTYIEDRGIDIRSFWKDFYYTQLPGNYEETRNKCEVDFLSSGIFSSHFVNTVSPSFLMEIVNGQHPFVEPQVRSEIINKWNAGCAAGILNAPDPSFNPAEDKILFRRYNSNDHMMGKKENKRFLQGTLGLIQDIHAPILFWPSRLDSLQKGCQLLSDILYHVISAYWDLNLEIIFVADGEFKKHFTDITKFHNFENRIAICDFDERLAKLSYAASDFVLMPSKFEPCGLPQMIGPIYGSLPIAHDTGGIHDTVIHIDVDKNWGNGFSFKHFTSNGLFWAITEAIKFYNLPSDVKHAQIERIMVESASSFNHKVTASNYINLYEKMLKRPLINEGSL